MTDNSTPYLSSSYDIQVRRTIPYYDVFIEEAIEIVGAINPSPEVWLDTGCGTGNLVQPALERFKDTRFLLADPSKGMIDISSRKFLSQKRVSIVGICPTQDLQDMDMEKPDVITALQCHHYMDRDNRAKATEVCYNILDNNGVFISFENISPFTEEGIKYGKQRWFDFQVSQGRGETEVGNHLERFGREYFPVNVEEHIELLRGCGFRVVEILWLSYMQAGFYCIK
jgi:tRNA (cmo5U34)-methyltransferase